MKKQLISFVGLFSLLLISYGAFSQGHTKNIGESYQYKVTPESATNTLLWTISGTPNVDWQVTGGSLSSSSVTITWLKPNDPGYNVSFTEEDKTALKCATTVSGVVKVQNTFNVDIANATSACATPLAADTEVTFVVTKTGGVSGDWSFNWATEGLDTNLNGIVTVTTGSPYNLVINLPHKDAGTTDQSFKVRLTNIKDNSGNDDTTSGDDVTAAAVTIYGVPATGSINW